MSEAREQYDEVRQCQERDHHDTQQRRRSPTGNGIRGEDPDANDRQPKDATEREHGAERNQSTDGDAVGEGHEHPDAVHHKLLTGSCATSRRSALPARARHPHYVERRAPRVSWNSTGRSKDAAACVAPARPW